MKAGSLLALALTCALLTVQAKDAPAWFTQGIVAQVTTKETAKFPVLAQRGVTIALVASDGDVAAAVAAAHAAGLKAIVDVDIPQLPDKELLQWVYTNAVPRLATTPADGWRTCGGVNWKGGMAWGEALRQAADALRTDFVLVSDNSRLGNQIRIYEADMPPPWSATMNSVLKGKKPVSELARMWAFMRANRPEGARFLRISPHWDATPIALSMCLDGVPAFSPGQALATCAKDVLPQFAALRGRTKAFTAGTLTWLEHDRPESVAAFLRTGADGSRCLCVFNLRHAPVTVNVKVGPKETKTYTFPDVAHEVVELTAAGQGGVERAARMRALVAAKLPRAQNLEMKNPKVSDWTARDVPAYLRGATMYQLFLRMFTPEGTLKAAERRLPFVRSLGTDIIYLCPIATADRGTDTTYWSARQKQSQLGNPCNPYRIADYFGVDPEYGTEQDLKDFVAAAHALGMKVYFDLVYYHCGPNAVFLAEHPDWVMRRPDGSFELGEWAFPRFEVKNPEVREYFFENMKWYLSNFDCDGFRCDVGAMLPLWYREEAYRRNKEVKADVVMLNEGCDSRDQRVAFDLSYAFPMQHAISDFLSGKGSATNLSVSCAARERRFPKNYHWMRCFQNHDFANCAPGQSRWETTHGTDLNDALLATVFLLDGVPMVYNGQEIADTAPHSIWSNRFHGKWGIDWSGLVTETGRRRLELVRTLARFRHDHPALFDAPTTFLETPHPHAVYAFRRMLPDGKDWLVAVNISKKTHSFDLPKGFTIRLSGPASTLDPATGKTTLPSHGWFVAQEW